MRSAAVIILLFIVEFVVSSCGEARVQVSLEKDSLLTRDMVTVTLGDGESNWRFGPEDLRHNAVVRVRSR